MKMFLVKLIIGTFGLEKAKKVFVRAMGAMKTEQGKSIGADAIKFLVPLITESTLESLGIPITYKEEGAQEIERLKNQSANLKAENMDFAGEKDREIEKLKETIARLEETVRNRGLQTDSIVTANENEIDYNNKVLDFMDGILELDSPSSDEDEADSDESNPTADDDEDSFKSQ